MSERVKIRLRLLELVRDRLEEPSDDGGVIGASVGYEVRREVYADTHDRIRSGLGLRVGHLVVIQVLEETVDAPRK